MVLGPPLVHDDLQSVGEENGACTDNLSAQLPFVAALQPLLTTQKTSLDDVVDPLHSALRLAMKQYNNTPTP